MPGNWKRISHGKITVSHMKMQILHQSKHYFSHPNVKLKIPGHISKVGEAPKAVQERGRATQLNAKHTSTILPACTLLHTFLVTEDSSNINHTRVYTHTWTTAAFTEHRDDDVPWMFSFCLLMLNLVNLHEV